MHNTTQDSQSHIAQPCPLVKGWCPTSLLPNNTTTHATRYAARVPIASSTSRPRTPKNRSRFHQVPSAACPK
eukprot:scaffold100695_cov32-Tisochrysis_lutea.AAC.2